MHHSFYTLCEQHAAEVSYLWSLWHQALLQPNQNRASLIEQEKRIFNHIAGLMVNPGAAWAHCHAGLAEASAGDVFAAAQVAFRAYNTDWIRAVVEAAETSTAAAAGLLSTLNWLPADICHPWLKKFFTSKTLAHKTLALNACLTRNEDPGHYLQALCERPDCRAEPALQQAALAAIGQFKRLDLAGEVHHAAPELAYWALRARILLGEREVLADLKPFILGAHPQRAEAIALAFRTLPVAIARSWISELAGLPDNRRWVIQATGALGDPHALPWLLNTMRDPAFARLAGLAFTLITGLALGDSEFESTSPWSLEETLAHDSVELDDQFLLPWPNVAALERVWQGSFSRSLQPGERYCAGQPVQTARLRDLLEQAPQALRFAACYELACQGPEPLIHIAGRQSPQA